MTYAIAQLNIGKTVLFTNASLYFDRQPYKLLGVRRVKIRGKIFEQAKLLDLVTENSELVCRLEEVQENG